MLNIFNLAFLSLFYQPLICTVYEYAIFVSLIVHQRGLQSRVWSCGVNLRPLWQSTAWNPKHPSTVQENVSWHNHCHHSVAFNNFSVLNKTSICSLIHIPINFLLYQSLCLVLFFDLFEGLVWVGVSCCCRFTPDIICKILSCSIFYYDNDTMITMNVLNKELMLKMKWYFSIRVHSFFSGCLREGLNSVLEDVSSI